MNEKEFFKLHPGWGISGKTIMHEGFVLGAYDPNAEGQKPFSAMPLLGCKYTSRGKRTFDEAFHDLHEKMVAALDGAEGPGE